MYARLLIKFVLRLNTILGFQYRASTRLRLQVFKTQFENESRVGTPIRQNLVFTYSLKVDLIPARIILSMKTRFLEKIKISEKSY